LVEHFRLVARVLTPFHLLKHSLETKGLRGTLRRAQRIVAQRNEARRATELDRAFDAEHGIETATWVRVPELDTSSENRRHAVRYQPSSIEEFGLLMGKLDVDHAEFTFVDYGSGKGRVLLLAAAYPFKRILGVEFARSLDVVARENVATLGADAERIETFVMDATEFEPPAGPVVLYFFHPFAPPVLGRVLERVRASLERDPRPAYLVLTGPPEFAETVEANGFQRVDVDELGWLTRGVFAAPPA
jgi:hypothetical protein